MRYVFIYGTLSGLVIMAVLFTGLTLVPEGQRGFIRTVWFGYLVMIVALTFVFVAVKRYRDIECGGVIRFGRALLIGLATSGVAASIYVAIWEVYLAATDYAFMGEYVSKRRSARARRPERPAPSSPPSAPRWKPSRRSIFEPAPAGDVHLHRDRACGPARLARLRGSPEKSEIPPRADQQRRDRYLDMRHTSH